MKCSGLSHVLLDLDGTLLDTAPDLAAALNHMLKKHKRPPHHFSEIRPLASSGSRALLNLGFGIDDSHPDYPALREEFLRIYDEHLTQGTALFVDMEKVLDFIEQQGWSWGVVTNKPEKPAKALLEHFGLLKRCCCVIGGDNVEQIKPAPDGLLYACEQLAIAPEQCIYIGDHLRDVQAAKAANMRTIAVLYGYLLEEEDPNAWQADYYAQNCLDIIEQLKIAASCQKLKNGA